MALAIFLINNRQQSRWIDAMDDTGRMLSCVDFQPKYPPKSQLVGFRQPNNFRRWQLTLTIIVRTGRWGGHQAATI